MNRNETINTAALIRPRRRGIFAIDRKQLRETRAGFLFLLPWFAGMILLTLWPMLRSLQLSFTSYNMLQSPEWIGVANYVRMFTSDPQFVQAIKVTFIYVFLSVPLKLIFALFIALLLDRGLSGLSIYRTVYYIPTLLGSSVAIAMMWRKLFGAGGAVNQLIEGITGITPPDWVANPNYSLYTIILLSVWQFGSTMIIFLAGLKQIPAEYHEAAKIDGASDFHRLLRITIPLLTPVILFNLIIQINGAFQAFTPAFIISGGRGGPIDSTLFYTLYLYLRGFSYFEMGYASAMAWVLLLIIAVVAGIIFGTSRRWVNYSD
jgi:multiple sugar transport system permease protein